MSTVTIFRKTAAGHEELKRREQNLGVLGRRLLLFVNGTRDQQALAQLFGKQIYLNEELVKLEQAGLIQPQGKAAHAVPAVPMTDSSSAAGTGLLGRLFGRGSKSQLDPTQTERRREASLLLYDLLGPGADDLLLRLDKCNDVEQLDRFLSTAADLVERVRGGDDAQMFRRVVESPIG